MEKKNSLLYSAVISGLILAAVSLVVFLIEYVLDIKPVGIGKPIILMLVGLAVSIGVLVYLFRAYRTRIGGFISFKDAFVYCFVALLASTVVAGVFTLIFMKFFDPEYMKNIMEAQKDFMENYLQGKASDEQITQSLAAIDAAAAKMTPVSQFVKGLWTGAIFDGILALIVAAIMKKNASVFDDKQEGGVI